MAPHWSYLLEDEAEWLIAVSFCFVHLLYCFYYFTNVAHSFPFVKTVLLITDHIIHKAVATGLSLDLHFLKLIHAPPVR